MLKVRINGGEIPYYKNSQKFKLNASFANFAIDLEEEREIHFNAIAFVSKIDWLLTETLSE